LSVALFLGLLPAITLFAELLDTPWHGIVALVGWGLLLFGLPLLILSARDNFQIARAIRAGLRSGRVLRFAAPGGKPSDRPAPDDEDDDLVWSIELLADGGMTWRINDEPAPDLTLTTPTSVTNAPGYASIAAEWVRPWTAPGGETTWWNRRALSDAERVELRKHVKRAVLPYLFLPLITAYLGIGFFTGDWRDSPWTLIPAAALIAWVDATAIRMIPRVLRIRRDARAAMVVIFRPAGGDGVPAAEGEPGLGPPTEVLPYSRLTWTHDGQPARWRKSRGA
jgi:hypothetical protein